MPPLLERNLDRRPDPDALLAVAGAKKRGKLCIFLGAAPGVGKTYSMLERARAAKADGVDVVIGVVETHGRQETQALLEGLEIMPRRAVEYRGRVIEEFDMDAALARKPKLIVVDELAHSNAPDSRHPKRWQDIEELLEAGVDVWTALNIQHLESLADVVARITGVRVRETVPDVVLSSACDVILVDITPDELLQRLHDGKVYFSQTARLAARNFFTPGNLTALRELALRRTAERVDDQVVDYLRQHAIEGPWGAAERLLVCVGADFASDNVVRAAARLATALNAEWTAVFVERPGQEEADAERVKRVDDALRLAERLGASTERLSAHDLAGDLLRFARRENFTQIVLGRSRSGRLARFFRRSLTQELVRRSRDIAVHVVTDEVAPPPGKIRLPSPLSLAGGFAGATASVAVAVGFGAALDHWLHLPNLSMIFLVAVIFCALRFGLWAAIMAAFLSFLAFDFFFVEPDYDFAISEPQEILALLVFLVVAVITGLLAGRVREHSIQLTQRIDATRSLFEFSRKVSGAATLDDVAWVATAQAQKALGAQCVVALAPQEGELRLAAAWPPLDALEVGEMSAARWAFEKAEAAGWRTGTLPNVRFQFRPLTTPRGVVGVCGVQPKKMDEPLSAQEDRTLSAILDQTAIAIDRAQLIDKSIHAAALEENEKLRTTLLSSISHDLRTPLASITGAVTSLRELGDKMSGSERQDLLASIEEESGRLSRFVKNLLDMSRIEAGALETRRDWVDVGDAIRAATQRIRKVFPDGKVIVSVAPSLPFIRADANLLQQVLFNLLDNAHKYGGGAAVSVHARQEGGDLVVTVTDEGPGIKPSDLERIFEKFYRGGRPDGRKAGTGLGLSICRGLVEAMGGTISAQSPALRRRGTRMILRFPAAETRGEER